MFEISGVENGNKKTGHPKNVPETVPCTPAQIAYECGTQDKQRQPHTPSPAARAVTGEDCTARYIRKGV